MPLKRTPPPSVRSMSLSDPDIPAHSSGPSGNVTRAIRHKRRCQGSPPASHEFEDDNFKQEIKLMFEALQTNQTSNNLLFSKLSEDVSEIKKQNKQIQKTNQDIEKALEKLTVGHIEVVKRVEKIENTQKAHQEYITRLDKKGEDLQLASRPSTIEIRNITESDRETTADLTVIAHSIAKVLEVIVESQDIRDCYRLPAKAGSSKPIIVEFNKVSLKLDLLSAARKYNSSRNSDQKLSTSDIGWEKPGSPIYISEHLPGSVRRLFFLSREYAKKFEYKFCWTVNTKIYIKKDETSKAIKIYSEAKLS